MNRLLRVTKLAIALVFFVSTFLVLGGRAAAFPSYIFGTAFDATTGAPLANICIVLGPVKITCFTRTAADGTYRIDFPDNDLVTAGQELHFIDQTHVYNDYDSPQFQVRGATKQDAPMLKPGQVPAPQCTGGTPTRTVYLPNITKTLGGPNGWYTPFIVQNTGTTATKLEISFYKFGDGSLVSCRVVSNLAPGTSFADIPNADTFLPGDSQFSVVVRSFGSSVVSVVNEHQGGGSLAEAMSYVGQSTGATTVYLPNITRRFFGFVTPFVMQNLGTQATTAQARFVSFDGSAPTITVIRNIDVGRSQFIDPNSEPGLVDGKQYAVTVTATQPISVVVNTQDDQPFQQQPKAYSNDGVTTGAATLYGAYAPKNMDGIGRSATVVVQNLGTAQATPTISFTKHGGGSPTAFTMPVINAGSSGVFDLRYANGDTRQAFCSSASVPGCLADGDYSFVVTAPGGSIAAAVGVNSSATAMGYLGASAPTTKTWFPNVTRTLGGAAGWTTPLIVQSVSTSSLTLQWFRFSDGALITSQTFSMTPGVAIRVDPRTVTALSDDTQYAVVADGGTGNINGIVVELATGGDNAMIYEGFTTP